MISGLYFFSSQRLTRHSRAESLSFTDHDVHFFFPFLELKRLSQSFVSHNEFRKDFAWVSPKLRLPTGGLCQSVEQPTSQDVLVAHAIHTEHRTEHRAEQTSQLHTLFKPHKDKAVLPWLIVSHLICQLRTHRRKGLGTKRSVRTHTSLLEMVKSHLPRGKFYNAIIVYFFEQVTLTVFFCYMRVIENK